MPIEADEPPDTYAAGRDARDKEVEALKEERDEWKRVSGITHDHLLDIGHRLNAVHRQREALERERDRWIEAYEYKCAERENAHDLADGWKASLLVTLADRNGAWDKNRALERERDELRAVLKLGWSWGQYQWAVEHRDEEMLGHLAAALDASHD